VHILTGQPPGGSVTTHVPLPVPAHPEVGMCAHGQSEGEVSRDRLVGCLASKRSSSYVRGTSGLAPTSDIPMPMSGFVLISSASPQRADL
jgi:hypothetical protein